MNSIGICWNILIFWQATTCSCANNDYPHSEESISRLLHLHKISDEVGVDGSAFFLSDGSIWKILTYFVIQIWGLVES